MKLSKTAWCAITIIALFMFQMISVPFNANAQYPDRSGELPGLWHPSATEIVLLVAAAGVFVYAVWALNKAEKEKAKEEDVDEPKKESESSNSTQSSRLNTPTTNQDKSPALKEQFWNMQNRVIPTLSCIHGDGTDNLRIGLSFKF